MDKYKKSIENYKKVGSLDLRVEYAYAEVRTETPVITEPDIITGEVRETVALDWEYRRFETQKERDAFVDAFDATSYTPKRRTRRSFRGTGIAKIVGDTYAISAKACKVSQVARNNIVV